MGFMGVRFINPQDVLDSLMTREQQTLAWRAIVFFCTVVWAYGGYKLFFDRDSLKVKKKKGAKKLK